MQGLGISSQAGQNSAVPGREKFYDGVNQRMGTMGLVELIRPMSQSALLLMSEIA